MNDFLKPLVSIIIPVYNGESTISMLLDSIYKSTYENFEVLCIDDGSSDSTLSILKKYARKHDNLKIYSKLNGGVSSARNYGLKHASGYYVVFADSDDFLEVDYLEKLTNVCKKFDLVCAGSCNYRVYNEGITKSKINKSCKIDLFTQKEIASRIWEMINAGYFCQPWNKLYKLNVIKDNDLEFDCTMDIGEDLMFNLQYATCINSLTCIKDVIYNYNITTCCLTHKFRENRIEQHLKIIETYEKLLLKNGLEPYDAYKFTIKTLYGAFTDLFNKNSQHVDKKNFVKKCLRLEYVQKITKSKNAQYSKLYKLLVDLMKKERVNSILIISKFYNIIKYKKIGS